MKAMMIRAPGDADAFEMVEINKPQLKSGHVLIQVAATSVNTVDTMIRSMGADLAPIAPSMPALLGIDVAGTVVAVGDAVAEFEVGDEVYGCAGGVAGIPGALAQYMLVDACLIARKPKTLTMRQAAAVPLVGITAYEGLKRAGVTAGQQVLVHGGSGGVGHLALQLAKVFGAQVYSTGGGAKQLEMIQMLGATAIHYRQTSVADYVAEHTQGRGFDVVYDSVGGENLLNSFEAAALNGQIATTVSLLNLDLSMMHMKGLSLHVVFMLIPMLHGVGRAAHGDILRELAQYIDAGQLMPVLDDARYSLSEVAKAHRRLESGNAMGKVVVTVG